MADVMILAPFILSYEGGFVNDKDDRGGATNKGVTLNTWRKVGYDKDKDGDIDVDDLKLISDEDAVNVALKPYYWDAICADKYKSQSIANLMADWAWGSGAKSAAMHLQQVLGVTADGKIGPVTLAALNKKDASKLFNVLWNARYKFLCQVATRGNNAKFLSGWLRRLKGIRWQALVYNDKKQSVHGFADSK